MNTFWYNNIKILFDQKQLHMFWPNKTYTKEENFNAISRFLLYSGFVLSIYRNNSDIFFVFFIFIGLLAFLSKYAEKKLYKNINDYKIARHNNPKHTIKVQQSCKKPTQQNPFGNVMMTDYEDAPNRPPACPYDEIKTDINKKFVNDMYRDITDIYDNENSQRQFYTTANTTIPNDQINFAKWCYLKDDVCKQNPKSCTGFEVSGGGRSGNN